MKTADFIKASLDQLNPDGYQNIVEKLKQVCREHGDIAAFECLGHVLTFAELDRLSDQFAAYLTYCAGLEKGDRVALQMPNVIQYPVCAWGILKAGMIIVNTNPMYTRRELIHQFNDAGVKALVVIDNLSAAAHDLRKETAIKTIITTGVMDLHHGPSAESDRGQADDVCRFWQALSDGARHEVPLCMASMDDIAVLQYTGGTTGVSKGAILSHGNLFASAAMGRQIMVVPQGVREIIISPMPLYHVYGFCASVIAVVIKGGLSVLIPDPRNIDNLVQTMAAHPFTSMAGINTLYEAVLNHPDLQSIDFSAVLGVISGGTALLTDLAHRWEAVTKSKILEGYGLSETASNLCCNRPDAQQIGTVGRPLTGLEIKIVDDSGTVLDYGYPGELLVRGPHVMQGYWGQTAASTEAFDADGWFRTGDVAIVQEDGFVRIVDRIKDMIIVSGFNVYPNELEDIVGAHPGIVECAVIGIADARTGEAVKLFAVKRDDRLDHEALQAYCRENMTAYKVPKQIEFCDELPKSPVGKILRRELR